MARFELGLDVIVRPPRHLTTAYTAAPDQLRSALGGHHPHLGEQLGSYDDTAAQDSPRGHSGRKLMGCPAEGWNRRRANQTPCGLRVVSPNGRLTESRPRPEMARPWLLPRPDSTGLDVCPEAPLACTSTTSWVAKTFAFRRKARAVGGHALHSHRRSRGSSPVTSTKKPRSGAISNQGWRKSLIRHKRVRPFNFHF